MFCTGHGHAWREQQKRSAPPNRIRKGMVGTPQASLFGEQPYINKGILYTFFQKQQIHIYEYCIQYTCVYRRICNAPFSKRSRNTYCMYIYAYTSNQKTNKAQARKNSNMYDSTLCNPPLRFMKTLGLHCTELRNAVLHLSCDALETA